MRWDGADSPLIKANLDPGECTTTAIVDPVSYIDDRPLDEMSPVFRVVNPDALNTIFQRRSTDGWVIFKYCGYFVRATSDREISVHNPGNIDT